MLGLLSLDNCHTHWICRYLGESERYGELPPGCVPSDNFLHFFSLPERKVRDIRSSTRGELRLNWGPVGVVDT